MGETKDDPRPCDVRVLGGCDVVCWAKECKEQDPVDPGKQE